MFGQGWTGKEVTTEHVRSLPDQSMASPSDASNAADVLIRLPKYQQQWPNWETTLPPSLQNVVRLTRRPVVIRPENFTREEWTTAQGIVRQQQEERACTAAKSVLIR
jgi:hypothetical protein